MEFSREIDYKELMNQINSLQDAHGIVKISYLGESVFNKPIPMITLGDSGATKSVLYASTHHASENICTSVIMNFIEEYIRCYERYNQLYGINMRYLYKMRKIYIVPMLNPDGVEYRLNGLTKDNPIKDRIIAYNKGEDFRCWNANGRGVDLNHNYDAYFEEYKEAERKEGILNGKAKYSGEYPESEPETSALANFIRYNSQELGGILTFHSQGEEIYYKSRDICPEKSEHIAKLLSKMSGYKLSKAEGKSACGGLTDWAIKELNIPSFTLECGKGENPLPTNQILTIYSKLRELLFTFPILI